MDEAQRRRIKKHQQAMKAIAQRRKEQARRAPANAKVVNAVGHPLPVPSDIVASDYNNECFIVGGGHL